MNDFDAWNRADVLVNHLLATQPELVFAEALKSVGEAARTEPLACATAAGLDPTP